MVSNTTGHRDTTHAREASALEERFSNCRRKAARAKAAAARLVDGKKKQTSRHDTMTGNALRLAKDHRPGKWSMILSSRRTKPTST